MVNLSSRKRRHESSEKEPEREYIVAAILDKRIRGKKTQYLLNWKGYSTDDNTWEDESRLNCPDLLNQFEEGLNNRSNASESTSKSKTRSALKKSNHSSVHDDTDNSLSDEYQSVSNETATDLTQDEDDDDRVTRMPTRLSSRKKASSTDSINSRPLSTRRRSSRKVVTETNSRITSMSKNESSNEDEIDITEEDQPSLSSVLQKKASASPKSKASPNGKSLTTVGSNNNNSTKLSKKSSTHEFNINEGKTINLRLRITPSSNSSINLVLDDGNNDNDKTSLESNEDAFKLVDETDQVDKIEAVRNNHDGIAFRIKLINDTHSHWISSKVANRKYPQAIIAFWESHVEFM